MKSGKKAKKRDLVDVIFADLLTQAHSEKNVKQVIQDLGTSRVNFYERLQERGLQFSLLSQITTETAQQVLGGKFQQPIAKITKEEGKELLKKQGIIIPHLYQRPFSELHRAILSHPKLYLAAYEVHSDAGSFRAFFHKKGISATELATITASEAEMLLGKERYQQITSEENIKLLKAEIKRRQLKKTQDPDQSTVDDGYQEDQNDDEVFERVKNRPVPLAGKGIFKNLILRELHVVIRRAKDNKEAAKILKCHPDTLLKFINAKRITYRQLRQLTETDAKEVFGDKYHKEISSEGIALLNKKEHAAKTKRSIEDIPFSEVLLTLRAHHGTKKAAALLKISNNGLFTSISKLGITPKILKRITPENAQSLLKEKYHAPMKEITQNDIKALLDKQHIRVKNTNNKSKRTSPTEYSKVEQMQEKEDLAEKNQSEKQRPKVHPKELSMRQIHTAILASDNINQAADRLNCVAITLSRFLSNQGIDYGNLELIQEKAVKNVLLEDYDKAPVTRAMIAKLCEELALGPMKEVTRRTNKKKTKQPTTQSNQSEQGKTASALLRVIPFSRLHLAILKSDNLDQVAQSFGTTGTNLSRFLIQRRANIAVLKNIPQQLAEQILGKKYHEPIAKENINTLLNKARLHRQNDLAREFDENDRIMIKRLLDRPLPKTTTFLKQLSIYGVHLALRYSTSALAAAILLKCKKDSLYHFLLRLGITYQNFKKIPKEAAWDALGDDYQKSISPERIAKLCKGVNLEIDPRRKKILVQEERAKKRRRISEQHRPRKRRRKITNMVEKLDTMAELSDPDMFEKLCQLPWVPRKWRHFNQFTVRQLHVLIRHAKTKERIGEILHCHNTTLPQTLRKYGTDFNTFRELSEEEASNIFGENYNKLITKEAIALLHCDAAPETNKQRERYIKMIFGDSDDSETEQEDIPLADAAVPDVFQPSQRDEERTVLYVPLPDVEEETHHEQEQLSEVNENHSDNNSSLDKEEYKMNEEHTQRDEERTVLYVPLPDIEEDTHEQERLSEVNENHSDNNSSLDKEQYKMNEEHDIGEVSTPLYVPLFNDEACSIYVPLYHFNDSKLEDTGNITLDIEALSDSEEELNDKERADIEEKFSEEENLLEQLIQEDNNGSSEEEESLSDSEENSDRSKYIPTFKELSGYPKSFLFQPPAPTHHGVTSEEDDVTSEEDEMSIVLKRSKYFDS
jgi:hypothetical protein